MADPTTDSSTVDVNTDPASPNASPALSADDINSMYQKYLGRAPTASDTSFYQNANISPEQAATYIQASPEAAAYSQTQPKNTTVSAAGANSNIAATVGNQALTPTLPTGTTLTPQNIATGANTTLNNNVSLNPTGTQANVSTATATTVDPNTGLPYQQDAQANGQYQAATIGNATPQMTAAQGSVNPASTVQGQYDSLMNFGPDNTPDWAKGALATTNAAMAARGLGSSSIAAQASTAALMQAALPIAQQDAATNAQMNMANLTNEQQAAVTNNNARLSTMLSDQSQINAAQQFNAQNQTQVDEYFANLKSNIQQYNATQVNAMAQFNAGQENAMSQFNANMANQREQFNAQNQLTIDQSNVTWQRNVNTADTAAANADAQANATNLLNISNTAMNNLWQEYRDNASFAFTSGQNDKASATNIALATMNINANAAAASTATTNAMAQTLGTSALNVLTKVLGNQ